MMRPWIPGLPACGACFLILWTGCPAPIEPGALVTSTREHCRFSAPAEWSMSRELDALVLEAPMTGPLSRHTIAVRTVPRHSGWYRERTPELVYAATRRVLADLAIGQLIEGSVTVGGRDHPSFELSFRDPEHDRTYDRRHVTIVGDEHVFHIFHTAPAGELPRGEREFALVLSTFEELP